MSFFKGSAEADKMLVKQASIRAAGLKAEAAFKKALIRRAGLQTEEHFFGPRGVFAKAGHTGHLKENPGILGVDDPVYNTRQRFPKYSGEVSPLSAHGSDGVKMLVRRLPQFTKADHLEHARAHKQSALSLDEQYQDMITDELAALKRKGIERGPLISGIVSGQFPETVKNALRQLATQITKHRGAAWLHDQAARSRMVKNPITVVGNPLRKSKPEWYYDAGMRSYILDLKGSVYILSPTGNGFKYSLSVGGNIIHYSKTFPEIELAMDAIDHGQDKTFKRPPGIYGSTRLKPNPPARINTTVAGVLYNRCVEIRAEKTAAGKLNGLYYHPFLERSKVCVLALDNGDILIHSQAGKKLWKLD